MKATNHSGILSFMCDFATTGVADDGLADDGRQKSPDMSRMYVQLTASPVSVTTTTAVVQAQTASSTERLGSLACGG